MATQTVQATNTTPKKKIKIAPIVCFIVTVIPVSYTHLTLPTICSVEI